MTTTPALAAAVSRRRVILTPSQLQIPRGAAYARGEAGRLIIEARWVRTTGASPGRVQRRLALAGSYRRQAVRLGVIEAHGVPALDHLDVDWFAHHDPTRDHWRSGYRDTNGGAPDGRGY